MTDKSLGAYQRTTPDPDETTDEALARLQAEITRLLDEADAELRDEVDGGVAAALIEKEAEKPDLSVDYHAMWWKAEREREKAERERDEARGALRARLGMLAESRPLTPDAITLPMVMRAAAVLGKYGYSPTPETVRRAIAAALTEPPERPEGAEAIERLLMDADREGGAAYRNDGYVALADWLAERGVRVVAEDGAA